MMLHLINARKLSQELASGAVSGRDQAGYLAASFVIWLVPFYLFLVPPQMTLDPGWYWSLYAYEAVLLLIIFVVGTFYCFRKCAVDPHRNFLIDFSCLYAPVSLSTLVIGWAAFHIITKGGIAIVKTLSFTEMPPGWLVAVVSTRFYDLLRYLTIVGVSAVIFIRIAGHLDRISHIRLQTKTAL